VTLFRIIKLPLFGLGKLRLIEKWSLEYCWIFGEVEFVGVFSLEFIRYVVLFEEVEIEKKRWVNSAEHHVAEA
jgi:hypothetical protein